MEENKNIPETEVTEEAQQAAEETEVTEEEVPVEEVQPDPTEELKAKLAAEHENYLRLAAEYDNFRKRTQKERESIGRASCRERV